MPQFARLINDWLDFKVWSFDLCGVFLLLLLLMQVYGPISSIDAVKTSSVGT